MNLISATDLHGFAVRVLEAAGMAAADARSAADCLVLANLRGVDSHGALRLRMYADALRAGEVNPNPDVRVLHRTGAVALIDADGGYGFRPALMAIGLAIEIARELGVGAVGVRNSHHLGMAATYVARAAEAGLIGLVVTTSTAHLAPPGGTRPVVGNNPIACAIPRRPPAPPIVLDMALSEVALGKIRLAAAEGRPIPAGWAFDEHGLPTTDPVAALRSGLMTAIGGHKGYGLAVITELLAAALTQSPLGPEAASHLHRAGGGGHLFLSLHPAAFGETDAFQDGVERLVAYIKEVPVAEDTPGPFVPGDIEEATAVRRRIAGIPVSDQLAARLNALAQELAVAPPAWRPAPSGVAPAPTAAS